MLILNQLRSIIPFEVLIFLIWEHVQRAKELFFSETCQMKLKTGSKAKTFCRLYGGADPQQPLQRASLCCQRWTSRNQEDGKRRDHWMFGGINLAGWEWIFDFRAPLENWDKYSKEVEGRGEGGGKTRRAPLQQMRRWAWGCKSNWAWSRENPNAQETGGRKPRLKHPTYTGIFRPEQEASPD